MMHHFLVSMQIGGLAATRSLRPHRFLNTQEQEGPVTPGLRWCSHSLQGATIAQSCIVAVPSDDIVYLRAATWQ